MSRDFHVILEVTVNFTLEQSDTHQFDMKLPFSCSHSSTGLANLKGIFLLAI